MLSFLGLLDSKQMVHEKFPQLFCIQGQRKNHLTELVQTTTFISRNICSGIDIQQFIRNLSPVRVRNQNWIMMFILNNGSYHFRFR